MLILFLVSNDCYYVFGIQKPTNRPDGWKAHHFNFFIKMILNFFKMIGLKMTSKIILMENGYTYFYERVKIGEPEDSRLYSLKRMKYETDEFILEYSFDGEGVVEISEVVKKGQMEFFPVIVDTASLLKFLQIIETEKELQRNIQIKWVQQDDKTTDN